MLDSRQREYLQTMGVDYYLPRHPLPAARPSASYVAFASERPSLTVDSERCETALAKHRSPVAKKPAVQMPSLDVTAKPSSRQLPSAQTGVEPGGVDVTAASSAAPASAKSTDVPEFTLCLVARDGFAIVDSAAPNAEQLQLQRRLLGNILFALTGGVYAEPALDVFRWPLVKNHQIAQGEAQAVETLSAYMTNYLVRFPSQQMIVMGAVAGDYIPRSLSDTVAYRHTISALDALEQPIAKKRIWQDIKTLRRGS